MAGCVVSTGIRRVCIVGGVAGGASAAARLRRLDETASITVFEKGEFASFANCGLPYYIGNVIPKEESLLVATPKFFKDRFNVDIRTRQEVMSIDRSAKTIEVKNLASGEVYKESYDTLVLSPGATPICPPIPGIDLPGVFVIRTIPDANTIKGWIGKLENKSAVIVGGGFIGLEMAENLHQLGLKLTILEGADQVMPPVDAEIAAVVAEELRDHNVDVVLSDPVSGFEKAEDGSIVTLAKSGRRIPAGMVILAIGVRPDVGLAKNCGLNIGQRGGISVNDQCQTSDANIYAVGDAVEVDDFITREHSFIPLAGPANRQGRAAADNIVGKEAHFRGVQGTAICKVFNMTVAITGKSEKAAVRSGMKNYKTIQLHPAHHAGYYPGSTQLHLKVIFDEKTGQIYGAQCVGRKGVAKRIDVISMAIQKKGTMEDLAQCELCYAPQFGSAKDPVNLAGFIATNFLRGDCPLADWNDIKTGAGVGEVVLDVREAKELEAAKFERTTGPEAIHIPLNSLRTRHAELPKDKPINVLCRVGQRGYIGVRILRQLGYDARLMSGGMISWRMMTGKSIKF